MIAKLPQNQMNILNYILKWLLLAGLVAVFSGSVSALFLWALDRATVFREANSWIIAFLPVGGLIVGLIYHYFGQGVEKGNNLIIDEIHEPQKLVPKRMAPLVLVGTILTHLFGGSAGREGTAVQMGASLADRLSVPFRLTSHDRRTLLMAGMSAGFGSVFGTPLAGAVFGLEVLTIGRMRYEALFPCFVASILADQITLAWHIHHTAYPIGELPTISFTTFAAVGIGGILFGLTGQFFAKTTHLISAFFKRRIAWAPLRPFVGGIIVALGVWAIGSTKFIGLGIPTMVAAFDGPVGHLDFLIKFVFTVVTLGAGFKGGEVTPLFFIGATLGNALAFFSGTPNGLLTGVGFVAVFAGAANTPISSTIMAIELFGPKIGVFAGLGCVISYLFSGHSGIYHSQRRGHDKLSQNYRNDENR